jgi:ribonuclease HIII
MRSQNTCTIQFSRDELERVRGILEANKWVNASINNEYVLFRLKSPTGSVGTMYSSGKLVFQGQEDFTTIVANLKSEDDSAKLNGFKSHIGVDEVGKGDYFGPLVVVGCFVDSEFAKKINYLGFADSKKFGDRKIRELFSKVEEYPYYYASVIHPLEYNELVKKYGNVSVLLAKQHSLVIERGLLDLKSKGIKCDHVVLDQFSSSKSRVSDELGEMGKAINVMQFHKGESDIAVAAASIIARGVFLKEWDVMCKKYDFQFPKGASTVIDDAKMFVSIHGFDKLQEVAKIGFKTTLKVNSLF